MSKGVIFQKRGINDLEIHNEKLVIPLLLILLKYIYIYYIYVFKSVCNQLLKIIIRVVAS